MIPATSALTALRHAPITFHAHQLRSAWRARRAILRPAAGKCRFRGPSRLAILQRGIEQLPAGDEIAQHAFQTRYVDRAPDAGDAGNWAVVQRRQDSVLVTFQQTKIDAVRPLIILVIDVDAGRSLVIILQNALPDRLFDRTKRGNRRSIRQPLHRRDAVLFENALHPADGVTLAVQKTADAPEQVDIVRAVVAPAAAPLHRLDLGAPGLPEPQHVLGDVEVGGDLADGPERIRRLVQMPAPVLVARLNGLVGVAVAVGGAVAVDPLLQNGRRLEHHHATRRNRHLGAGLGVAADTLAFLAHHERAER